jgi:hypothetical protein
MQEKTDEVSRSNRYVVSPDDRLTMARSGRAPDRTDTGKSRAIGSGPAIRQYQVPSSSDEKSRHTTLTPWSSSLRTSRGRPAIQRYDS